MKLGTIAKLRGGRVLSILLSVRSVLLSIGREGHTEPMTLILSSTCSFTYHVIYYRLLTTLSAYQCIEYSILSPSNHPQHPHTVPKQEFSFPFLLYRQQHKSNLILLIQRQIPRHHGRNQKKAGTHHAQAKVLSRLIRQSVIQQKLILRAAKLK